MKWIAIDLDRTLAHYESGDYDRYGVLFIGEPVQPMVDLVKEFLSQGKEVRIFTARVDAPKKLRKKVTEAIEKWCLEHIGAVLPVTNKKDRDMDVLYDDRARQVEANTGRLL